MMKFVSFVAAASLWTTTVSTISVAFADSDFPSGKSLKEKVKWLKEQPLTISTIDIPEKVRNQGLYNSEVERARGWAKKGDVEWMYAALRAAQKYVSLPGVTALDPLALFGIVEIGYANAVEEMDRAVKDAQKKGGKGEGFSIIKQQYRTKLEDTRKALDHLGYGTQRQSKTRVKGNKRK